MPPLFSQQYNTRKPLVSFSNRERATLAVSPPPMPKRSKRRGASNRTTVRRRRKTAGSNKIRVVGGKVRLRVTGYQGLQSLSPSALVRFIPTTKLRLAARRVLNTQGRIANRKRRRTVKRKKRRTKRSA